MRPSSSNSRHLTKLLWVDLNIFHHHFFSHINKSINVKDANRILIRRVVHLKPTATKRTILTMLVIIDFNLTLTYWITLYYIVRYR